MVFDKKFKLLCAFISISSILLFSYSLIENREIVSLLALKAGFYICLLVQLPLIALPPYLFLKAALKSPKNYTLLAVTLGLLILAYSAIAQFNSWWAKPILG